MQTYDWRLLGVFLSIVVFLSSCGGGKKVAEVETNPKPEWITSRPVDANYYIGIGIASKTIHPLDYAVQAKKHALNEMASEIKVKVSSNSMLFSFEDESGFKDDFKSFTKLSTNELIENFEQVAAWEDKNEYWVFYRLSKAQYQKDKQARIDKAISQSLESVVLADNLSKEGSYTKALLNFFQAVEPIKPYLGEALETSYNEKKVYLGNYIGSRIVEIVNHFNLRATKNVLNVKWGSSIPSSDLTFHLTDDKGRSIEGMPLIYHYSHGILRPKYGVTDKEGKAYSSISKIKKRNDKQKFKVTVDFSTLFLKGKEADEFTEKLFKQFTAPFSEVSIQVSAPTVLVSSVEKLYGKPVKDKPLLVAVKEALFKKGFRLVSSRREADLLIKVNANTIKGTNTNGLHNSILAGFVSITDAATKKEVYSEELVDIKGVKGDFNAAGLNAYLKASIRLKDRSIPRFYRTYMK